VEGYQETKKGQKNFTTSQGTWARSNVEKEYTFAEHLERGF
jgi:hypothetical protein